MGVHQNRWGVRARRQLIEALGACCAACDSTFDLEIDHLAPRGWVARSVSSSQRVSIYRREAKAGLVQVLCSSCNKSKGQPVYAESNIECPF